MAKRRRFRNGRQPDFMTVTEISKVLGVIDRRVRQFIEEGRLPALYIGGIYLIKREDFEAFAAQPRRRGRPQKKEVI